jgi:uncharacterized repeat protein (TIGR03803 family)
MSWPRRSPIASALAVLALVSVGFLSGAARAQTAVESVLAPLNYNSGAAVIQAADGNFYGTSYSGFSNGGTVFKVTPAGAVTYPYTFQGGTDGGVPQSPPVQGPDGTLYGVTSAGGAFGYGVIYNVNPAMGTETVLYSFDGGADGGNPAGALIFDNSGNLYGVTTLYGADNFGVAYKFNLAAGKLTPLHAFCSMSNCDDGTSPAAGLVQGTDGNFYGTALTGGAYGNGTFYKVTSSGTFTLLYSFCVTDVNTCAEGYAPHSAVAEGSDGNFYGSNQQGGANTLGTIYKATPGGTVTPVYTFTGGTDGSLPYGPVFGSDGNLYGATQTGGLAQDCNAHGCGSVFQLTPAGTLNLLYDFADSNADANPYAAPMQGSDGNLYGTTSGLKTNEAGAVYKLVTSPALAAPVQLAFGKSSVAAGTQVTLSWKALNVFSMTLQQCYAYVQGSAAGGGAWTGLQAGTYNSSTHLYSGAAAITPTIAGNYTYALTCGGMESGFAALTVTGGGGKQPSATALTATPTSVSVGQSVTLKATVTGAGGTPTGTVAFVYAGSTLATVPLNGAGIASLAASSNGYPPGNYPITAEYTGNSTYNSSQSAAVTVMLKQAPTTTAVTASPNPVTPPAAVTLTATVKRSASGAAGAPTGTVTFFVQTLEIGTAHLNAAGVGAFSAPSNGIAAGTYPVTAKYSGDSSDVASTSPAANVIVK